MKTLRLLAGDAQPLGEPEVGEAVGDPVVDHLRHAALLGAHRIRLQAEHPRGGGEVDVGVRGEVRLQPLVRDTWARMRSSCCE